MSIGCEILQNLLDKDILLFGAKCKKVFIECSLDV